MKKSREEILKKWKSTLVKYDYYDYSELDNECFIGFDCFLVEIGEELKININKSIKVPSNIYYQILICSPCILLIYIIIILFIQEIRAGIFISEPNEFFYSLSFFIFLIFFLTFFVLYFFVTYFLYHNTYYQWVFNKEKNQVFFRKISPNKKREKRFQCSEIQNIVYTRRAYHAIPYYYLKLYFINKKKVRIYHSEKQKEVQKLKEELSNFLKINIYYK